MTAEPISKAGLYAKMAAVMGELSNIPKTGTNSHFNYKFVTADAVADKVRDLLAEKGIAFFASIVGRELMDIGSKKRWVVNFEFTFADGESGATETKLWSSEADANDDKGINKCATAAEKYFLLKTFVVSSADEPDADADGDKKRTQGTQNGRNGQQPPVRQQPAPAPHSGGQTGTSASASPNGLQPSGDGSPDKLDQSFPPQVEGAVITPLNTEGDDKHLPRDANGLPILGSLDMGRLVRLSVDEKLVTGRSHFSNLIDLLWREGAVRAASKPQAVMDAIRKHEAEKDLAKEGVTA